MLRAAPPASRQTAGVPAVAVPVGDTRAASLETEPERAVVGAEGQALYSTGAHPNVRSIEGRSARIATTM